MEVLLILFCAIAVGAMIIYQIYCKTSHDSYDSCLQFSAKISKIDRKEVGLKGERCYRTTVLFDDGFSHVSHKTDRDDGFVSYKISMPSELTREILSDAFSAHNNALIKQHRFSSRKVSPRIMGIVVYEHIKSATLHFIGRQEWAHGELPSTFRPYVFSYHFALSYKIMTLSCSASVADEILDSILQCFFQENATVYSAEGQELVEHIIKGSLTELAELLNDVPPESLAETPEALAIKLYRDIYGTDIPTETRHRNIVYEISSWVEADTPLFKKYTVVSD